MSRSLCLMLVWISLCVGGGLTVSDAQAQSRGERDRGSAREAPKARISLDQAANMVRRRTKGEVIRASTRRSGNSIVHHIRVNDNGKVSNYTVNAVTGAIR